MHCLNEFSLRTRCKMLCSNWIWTKTNSTNFDSGQTMLVSTHVSKTTSNGSTSTSKMMSKRFAHTKILYSINEAINCWQTVKPDDFNSSWLQRAKSNWNKYETINILNSGTDCSRLYFISLLEFRPEREIFYESKIG